MLQCPLRVIFATSFLSIIRPFALSRLTSSIPYAMLYSIAHGPRMGKHKMKKTD